MDYLSPTYDKFSRRISILISGNYFSLVIINTGSWMICWWLTRLNTTDAGSSCQHVAIGETKPAPELTDRAALAESCVWKLQLRQEEQ